jgi:hypothetical protein
MIDNKYIYEVDLSKLDLDVNYFCNLVLRLNEGLEVHKLRFNAMEDAYTQSIYQKYPCLSPIINIYRISPNWTLEMHVDSNRQCALNIPIRNTKNTDTVFYEFAEEPILEHDSVKKVYNVKSKVVESFRFSMNNPVLINTVGSPHAVINHTDDYRITMSWSMKPEITFDQAKSIFLDSYSK